MVNGMTKEMELEKKEEEGLNLADYGFMFLSHWYWFVASVVVAMVIAVYYIMSTTPIYTTSTQLLIRDDKNNKLEMTRTTRVHRPPYRISVIWV